MASTPAAVETALVTSKVATEIAFGVAMNEKTMLAASTTTKVESMTAPTIAAGTWMESSMSSCAAKSDAFSSFYDKRGGSDNVPVGANGSG